MLQLSIEELCALKLVLSITSVEELLSAAEIGFSSKDNDNSTNEELADACSKALLIL